MKNHWLDEVKKRLEADAQQPGVAFERLQAMGMINERGEVTGKLHRWDAYLAITEVQHASDGKQIAVFRCLKPVFGMPSSETRDVSRDSMMKYLRDGKKIITARWDQRLSIWRQGCAVHLSDQGSILCESGNDVGDDVGELPELQPAIS